MLQIAIVENEPSDLELLTRHLEILEQQYYFNLTVHSFLSIHAFQEAFVPGRFDLIFLDIYMDDGSGMELAHEIRRCESSRKTMIVFCTESEMHAVQSYRVGAMDYLLKPFQPELLADVVLHAARTLHRHAQTISVKQGREMIVIPVADIVYIDFDNHYACFHTVRGINKSYMSAESVRRLIDVYPCFCNCFRNCLVNMDHVLTLQRNYFTLDNGENMPISRSLLAQTRETYSQYVFGKLEQEMQ